MSCLVESGLSSDTCGRSRSDCGHSGSVRLLTGIRRQAEQCCDVI
jgi:hypothetical protein